MTRPARLLWLCGLLLLGACPPPPRVSAVEKPGSVTFEITSNPSGAQVNVDGSPLGETPLKARLTPGPHRVQFNKSGYFPLETSVEVPGQGGSFAGTLVASH